MTEPDPSARYAFCAAVEQHAGTVRICGVGGVIEVEDDDEVLVRVVGVLRALNATATLAQVLAGPGLPFGTVAPLLAELLGIGAVHDVRQARAYFHRLSANPCMVAAPMGVEQAYALDRWRPPPGPSVPLPEPQPSVMDGVRRSAQLEAIEKIEAGSSLDAAIALAPDAYRRGTDGHRPLASGGAMWPLQLWAVGGDGPDLSVLAIDHDRDRWTRVRVISRDQWCRFFMPDPDLRKVLRLGAATVVITADPSRTCGKYGNRGWRYALMEAGAAAHHIGLLAAERQVAARTVCGFYDEPLTEALGGGVPALLTVLIMK